MRGTNDAVTVLAVLAGPLVTGVAFAQGETSAGVAAPSATAAPPAPPTAASVPAPSATAAVSAPPAAASLPAPAPSALGAPAPAESDHDRFVHHFALGYLGFSQLPIAVPPGGPGGAASGSTVNAPVLGLRYWFGHRIGLDAGVGFGVSTGSQSGQGAAVTPSTFGVAVSGGLPIALASASHFTFEIVPQVLLGGTSGSIGDQSLTGLRLDVGARAGAEIQFGFIGIPELALQATVGVYYSHQTYGWSEAGNSSSVQSDSLSTGVQADPWAIFANSISALYYLP